MIKTKETLLQELDFGIKLAQIKGSIEFLHYMNTEKKESARTLTEQMTTQGLIKKVEALQKMFKEIKK
jgi:hypothetical protein